MKKKTDSAPFSFQHSESFIFLGQFFIFEKFLPVKESSILGSSPCFFPLTSN